MGFVSRCHDRFTAGRRLAAETQQLEHLLNESACLLPAGEEAA